MMPTQPMQHDDGSDEQTLLQQLIAELQQLAQGGRASELAQRLGKAPMPPAPMGDQPPDDGAPLEGSPEEEAGEDPATEDAEPVPGAETDDPGEGGAAMGGKPDPEKMRALLAKMKSKPSMG